MIGLRINQAKGLFFTSSEVIRATNVAERKVLSKFGAFVRQRARTSMKRRKKPSAPGQPPSAHVGLIKKFLFFVYEPTRHSVIIGPALLDKPSVGALEVLEHGGSVTIIRRPKFGPKNKDRVNIAARPFMQPAFDKELPGVAGLWKDQIHN